MIKVSYLNERLEIYILLISRFLRSSKIFETTILYRKYAKNTFLNGDVSKPEDDVVFHPNIFCKRGKCL